MGICGSTDDFTRTSMSSGSQRIEYTECKKLCKSLHSFVPALKHCRVIKVYDADTITVSAKVCNMSNPIIYKFSIRLSGIDTPELKSKCPNEKKHAIIARDWLKTAILGHRVDLNILGIDKYGRLLGRVYFNSKCMNDELLKIGFARVYDGRHKEPWVFPIAKKC